VDLLQVDAPPVLGGGPVCNQHEADKQNPDQDNESDHDGEYRSRLARSGAMLVLCKDGITVEVDTVVRFIPDIGSC
jgi:hypothetical protein